MPGGVRLVISREASHDTSPVPRNFVWWSKIDTDENFDFSCREEHFVEQKSAKDARRDEIKGLIAAGVTHQNKMVPILGRNASNVCRGVLREMLKSGEVLMDRQTKELSLPNPDASKAKGTDDNASG
jgi:hypothetical protein